MDKLFLQLTNQVAMGYHNERLSLENACIRISKAESEIDLLTTQLDNIETELPQVIKNRKSKIVEDAKGLSIFQSLFFVLNYWFFYLTAQMPLLALLCFNLMAIIYIVTICELWESHRKVTKMTRPEQILFITNHINEKIEKERIVIETNTAKAKQHAANMRQLQDLHNKS